MSIKNFGGIVHIGTYNDHHKEATFHVPPGTNPADIIRAFMAENAEDIPSSPTSNNRPENDSSSPAATNESQSKLFPCITKAAYDAGKAESVNDELRSASVSAPKLIKALNLNEALGYVDTKNMNSIDLYNLLDDCYELKFGPRNFSLYRSK